MIVDKFMYFLPLFIFIIFYVHHLKYSNYRIKAIRDIRKKGIKGFILEYMYRLFTPKERGKTFNRYRVFLQYTKWDVKPYFLLKLFLVIIVLIMILLIKLTNINIYTQRIFESYEYRADLIYETASENIDKVKALETEITLLKDMLVNVKEEDIEKLSKDNLQQMVISSLSKKGLPVLTSPQNIANKVYYRLKDYYSVKKSNYIIFLWILVLVYFIPDLFVSIHNLFVKSKAASELIFLKKLVILNGSIKPTSYNEVLDVIIYKSKYYKNILKKIQFLRNKNTIDNKKIYTNDYLGNIKDLELKLFLEKLDQADNYDYNQAILNIENEFKTDKRERARKIKKRIELMEFIGIAGSMGIIALITIYLLLPWLSIYDMSSFF